jgi:hypothetical protein
MVQKVVAQTVAQHPPSVVDKYAQRTLGSLLTCTQQGELLAVSNVPPSPSIFGDNVLFNNRTPAIALLGTYHSPQLCESFKGYLNNIFSLGGFPVEKPNQLSIPLNVEGTQRAVIPYVTKNSETHFKINNSVIKGK